MRLKMIDVPRTDVILGVAGNPGESLSQVPRNAPRRRYFLDTRLAPSMTAVWEGVAAIRSPSCQHWQKLRNSPDNPVF